MSKLRIAAGVLIAVAYIYRKLISTIVEIGVFSLIILIALWSTAKLAGAI